MNSVKSRNCLDYVSTINHGNVLSATGLWKGWDVEYFRIKNWEKYQPKKKKEGARHYWIRLDTAALDDPKTALMTNSEFGIWCRLLLIARRMDNQMPHVRAWLCKRLRHQGAHRGVDLQFLWVLGLVEACPAALQDKTGQDKTLQQKDVSAVSFGLVTSEQWTRIWKAYPKPPTKAGLMAEITAKIFFESKAFDQPTIDVIESAIANYAEAVREMDGKFVRNFKRFFEDDFWRSYIGAKKTKPINTRLME